MEFAQVEALDKTYSVDFFDVGNADCTLLTNGENTMLIDAGDAANAKYVAKKIDALAITDFDYVVITNEGEAHSGGLMAILNNYSVDTLIVPDLATEDRTLQSCIKVAENKGVTIKQAQALDAWNVGEAQVQVLSAGVNVIIRFSIQAHSFLLMGDASLEEENALLELDMDISATVLKASQRGAAGTSSEMFLKMVAPEYVVISGNNDVVNTKTFCRLCEQSGAVYTTDDCGMITFLSNGKNVKIETDRNDCELNLVKKDVYFVVP
jgi:beta-lactamase superfamily II metal-dependent hydrolase